MGMRPLYSRSSSAGIRVVGCCLLRKSTATILTTAPYSLCRRLLTTHLECAFYRQEIRHAPMPWAQGVGRSNRPAPTKAFSFSILLLSNQRRRRRRAPVLVTDACVPA